MRSRDILIARYLTGEASPDEITELQEWLGATKDNLLYFQQLKNIWDNSEHQISEGMTDAVKAFNMVKKRITYRTPAGNFLFYWKKVAAILIIPLVLGNVFYFAFRANPRFTIQEPVYNEMFVAFGTRSELKLPDGTSVWLNSGSSIKYPDRFTGKNRTVFINGEAYFDIESDPGKAFIVETSSLRVKAIGTKFNVSAYAADDEVNVTLVSGKVEVCPGDDQNRHNSSSLDINQHFSFNKADGTSSITSVDSYKYISWIDGKLIFRNEPLSLVAKKMSRVFNIDIEIKGEEIQDYCYRATFQDESLSEILRLLKMSSPIDYIEVKRDPLPDGSFTKKKVIIMPAG